MFLHNQIIQISQRFMIHFLSFLLFFAFGGIQYLAAANFGDEVGSLFVNGIRVPIYSNGSGEASYQNNYYKGQYTGMKYQCPELVNRAYYMVYGKNIWVSGGKSDGVDYYTYPIRNGINFERYANGGIECPKPMDIISFSGGAPPGYNGHVGLVKAVDINKKFIIIANQNVTQGAQDADQKMPLYYDSYSRTYTVGLENTPWAKSIFKYKVQGWIRLPNPQFIKITAPSKYSVFQASYGYVQPVAMNWSNSGSVGSVVTIQAIINNRIFTLSENLPNDGKYYWSPNFYSLGLISGYNKVLIKIYNPFKPASVCYQEIYFYLRSGYKESIESSEEVFSVYPNPNKGNFSVNFTSGTTEDVVITLMDVTGREVLTLNTIATIGENTIPIDISGNSSGVYLLQMRVGGNVTTNKVVIE